MVPQPHDRLFRQTFADPEHAAALLRTGLPRQLAEAFDWSTLRLRTHDFVDERLREHRTDELYSVLDHAGIEHFAIVEHKAAPDPDTAPQMHGYHVPVHDQCRSQGPPGTPLPPILPIVVHHGPKCWTAPTTLLQGRGAGGHRYLDLELLVDDFARLDEQAILDRGLTDRGTATMLFLQVLRTAAPDDCASLLQRWQPLLRRVRNGRDGRRALGGLLTYALEVTELSREHLAGFAAAVGDPADKDAIMSTADKLRAEGRVEGHAEGRVEGRAEGRIETLLRQMTRRFGPLPATTVAHVRAGTPAELDAWTDRILTAPTLEALFAHG
jgi:predicted transposase/invertase (TIGR01784 family)